jgi:hypothetical protein
LPVSGIASILLDGSMTPHILLAVAGVLAFAAIVLTVRLIARSTGAPRAVDHGVVSTRWLSELKRDEPWTRS